MTTDNEPLDYIGMLRLAKAQYEETLTAVHIALDQTLGRDHRTRDDSAAAAIRRLAAEAGKRDAVTALRAFARTFREYHEPTSHVLAGKVGSDLADRAHLIEHGEVDIDGARIERGEATHP